MLSLFLVVQTLVKGIVVYVVNIIHMKMWWFCGVNEVGNFDI